MSSEYVKDSGLVFPRTYDILESMQDRFLELFGADFDITSQAHAGRIIEGATMLISRALGRASFSSNQANVNYATGKYLDTLASLFNITRHKCVRASRVCVFSGSKDCTIGAGSTVFSADGTKYEVAYDIYFRDEPQVKGLVVASTDDYDTEIKDVVIVGIRNDLSTGVAASGVWESVSCDDGDRTILGSPEESDDELRKRILAKMNDVKPFLVACKEKIDAIPEIEDCYLCDNGRDEPAYVKEDNTITTAFEEVADWAAEDFVGGRRYEVNDSAKRDGLTYRRKIAGSDAVWTPGNWREVPYATPMLEHSVLVVVDVDMSNSSRSEEAVYLDIAKAIYEHKTTGAAMTPIMRPHGTTDDEYHIRVDPAENNATYKACVKKVSYVPPEIGVAYEYTINIPRKVPFYIEVSVARHRYLGASLVQDIKDAVYKWTRGEVANVEGLQVGRSVTPFEVGNAISDLIPDIQIRKVAVSTIAPVYDETLGRLTLKAPMNNIQITPAEKGKVDFTIEAGSGRAISNSIIITEA